MVEYFSPELNKGAFNCPYCGVYAHQKWYIDIAYDKFEYDKNSHSYNKIIGLSVSICSYCSKIALWHYGKILLPQNLPVPNPPEDTPPEVKNIYIEAGNVLNDSPRASGALIRLALELLLQNINKNKLSLNENIKKLIERKIPEQLIKALSILRVNGNDIMHTGEIKITENKDDVVYLFEIFNMIVEELIEEPKKLNEFYKKIPESKRKEIEKDLSKDTN